MKLQVPSGFQTFTGVESWARRFAVSILASWGVDHREDGTHRFPWIDVKYDATRYTGSGSMTWSVDAGDQFLFGYRLVGDDCKVQWRIKTSDVGGTASNRLLIRLPEGIRPLRRTSSVHYYDNAGTEGIGLARLDSTLTKIELFLNSSAGNWTLTTSDNTYTEGTLTFPITQ